MMEQSKDKKKWLKTILLIMGSLLALLFAKAIGHIVGKSTVDEFSSGYSEGSKESILNEALSEAAHRIREQAPIKVDQMTTTTGAISSGREITYLMTLDADIPANDVQSLTESIGQENQRKICSEEKTRKLIEMGGIMSFQYTDLSGDILRTSISTCS